MHHRWELRGVGHPYPQLIDEVAIYEDANGKVTIMTGSWNQDQLIGLAHLVMTPGFELLSIRRLDAQP